MNSRTKWFGLLALISILVVWAWWPRFDSVGTDDYGNWESSDQLDDATAIGANPNVVATGHRSESEIDAASASADAPFPEALPAFDGVGKVRLLVLNDLTDQPVPNAAVYVLHGKFRGNPKYKLPYHSGLQVRAEMTRKYGALYRTDQEGVIFLPPMGYDTRIAVDSEGLFGLKKIFQKETTEVVVRLRPDPTLKVTIVNASGQQVPLAPFVVMTKRRNYVAQRAIHYTDQNGVAEINGFNAHSILQNGERSSLLLKAAAIAGRGELTPSLPVEISPELLALGEVQLHLPEYGGVRLHLQDAEGAPVGKDGSLYVSLADDVDGTPYDVRLPIEVKDGTGEIPFVGVGANLFAEFFVTGGENGSKAEVEGPARSGEWVDRVLVVEQAPYYIGVLVDPDGERIKNTQLLITRVVTTSDSVFSGGAKLSTDGEGGFRFEPRVVGSGVDPIEIQFVFSCPSENFGNLDAEVAIPTPSATGENALGRIQMKQATFLLSGTVLSPGEKAVPNATVTFSAASRQSSNGSFYRAKVGSMNAITDDLGYFEIRGEIEQTGSYEVEVNANGHKSLQQEISLGEKDVIFRLETSGRMQGKVLVDPEVKYWALHFDVRGRPNGGGQAVVDSQSPAGEIMFHVEGTQFDLFDLGIRGSLGLQPFFKTEGIELIPGEVVLPAEWNPLDLRGKLNLVKLTVRNEEGEMLDANLGIRSEGGSSATNISNGEKVLIAQTVFEEMTVSADGYISQVFSNVSTDQSVVLKRNGMAYVQYPKELMNYNGLEIRLTANELGRQPGGQYLKLDKEGLATLFLSEPGTYEIEVSVLKPISEQGFSFSSSTTVYKETIAIQALKQTVQLGIKASHFEEALKDQ